MTPKDWALKLIDALDAARRSGRVVHEHELTEIALEDAIAAEREACWQAVNALIKRGDLPEPAHSERNGLIMASNAIRSRGSKT